ncbi:hypothetical protein [Alicyclobacillus shizuokensis]|uniref:hypothetical protein n=1 Tax=Alicyclobacillus shizuokensis TaxID=392014 RepID=UPI000A9E049A
MACVITSPCSGEKALDCVEACPVDAIHDGGETYLIDPDVCIEQKTGKTAVSGRDH